MERDRHFKEQREGKGGKAFEPKTDEEALLALAMLGIVPPETK